MTNVGRENFYTCDACGAVMVTVDVDEGTTPMLTECGIVSCLGMSRSGWYGQKPEGAGPPTWEWYRPVTANLVRMSKETKLHVSLGGLLLRPRRQA